MVAASAESARSASVGEYVEYLRCNREAWLNELREFIRIPSVSSDPHRRADVLRCAEWLRAQLTRIGMARTHLIRTSGHPLVYSESRFSPSRPTILVYGHYDVQPAEPSNGWKSPPF